MTEAPAGHQPREPEVASGAGGHLPMARIEPDEVEQRTHLCFSSLKQLAETISVEKRGAADSTPYVLPSRHRCDVIHVLGAQARN